MWETIRSLLSVRNNSQSQHHRGGPSRKCCPFVYQPSFGFMCNVPFFYRAMQDKTFFKSARLQWATNLASFFISRTHKKLKPKCETDLPCALKLDPPRTYISQMRKQTPLRPQFTQVLMCTQDYISSPLSPSSSWFLPRCTAPSTYPDPGLHFWLLSRRLPLTEPAVTSSNSYRDHWHRMNNWTGCKLIETTRDCDNSKSISTV